MHIHFECLNLFADRVTSRWLSGKKWEKCDRGFTRIQTEDYDGKRQLTKPSEPIIFINSIMHASPVRNS